jgi:hypothetical protein
VSGDVEDDLWINRQTTTWPNSSNRLRRRWLGARAVMAWRVEFDERSVPKRAASAAALLRSPIFAA